MNPEQNSLQPDDLRALALQLAAFTELLEQRGTASSERLTAAAIEQFRQAAAGAVSDGLRQPLEDATRTMQGSTQNVLKATSELEARVRTAGRGLTATAWKAFVASALASVAVIGVAVYVGVRTHRDMARSEWTGLINAAIANGKLAQCSDGGLCARAGKKWVRIDQ